MTPRVLAFSILAGLGLVDLLVGYDMAVHGVPDFASMAYVVAAVVHLEAMSIAAMAWWHGRPKKARTALDAG